VYRRMKDKTVEQKMYNTINRQVFRYHHKVSRGSTTRRNGAIGRIRPLLLMRMRCPRDARQFYSNKSAADLAVYKWTNVRIDWTEVPFHSSDFFLEYFVPESCLELTLSQGRGRDTHGFLPTTKKDLHMMLTIVMTRTEDLDPRKAFLVP
jgi:hypothetical protein